MTTPEPTRPTTSRDLMLIHMIISRAIEVTRQKGQEFLAGGFPDDRTRQGYHDYVHCLVSVLAAHHLAEDEVVFPQLGIRIPSAPYKLLSADHQEITAILEDMGKSLDSFDGDGIKPAISSILASLDQLRNMWYPHIGIEESQFSEQNLNRVLSPEEQGALSQQISRHSQAHISPDYLVIPFLLFNLPPLERRLFAAGVPPVVTQQLVPYAWKEKWAPMKPFLLFE